MVDSPSPVGSPAPDYVVVARRYRPQTFEELIGQEHVARALSNAITTNRVGHAYLFTGARGVGKTSAARIFAKALNCVQGPTPRPCNQCDICERISTGDDVDVLEIDGASNRGIDDIRQLRQNVNIRPSRERLKIYIIDEVHMLSKDAFNALLKTLEEPPEHVKFIFCTTEPGKIPITILSRCQRFDFAGIRPASITARLRQIVASEGVEAESAALELLARRANGSMRDSQSLLEQLLAFAPGKITEADVNAMLGTAGEERLTVIVDRLLARDAAAALRELDGALQQGVEVAQLMEQLLGYLRDTMAAAAGCAGELFLHTSPTHWPQVVEAAKQWGLDAILAAMQIVDHALARMSYSMQGRVLAELALVRICQLEDLEDLRTLLSNLRGGVPAVSSPSGATGKPAPAGEKKNDVTPPPLQPAVPERSIETAAIEETQVSAKAAAYAGTAPETAVPTPAQQRALTAETAASLWAEVLAQLPGFATEHAKQAAQVAISAPNRLAVSFQPAYTFSKAVCERADQKAKFEQKLAELTGSRVQLEFRLLEEQTPVPARVAAAATVAPPHVRLAQVMDHPLVVRASQLFRARPTRVDDAPRNESRSGVAE